MGDRPTALVRCATDLTPAFCTAALRPLLGDARVVALTADPVGTGQVADTLRLHLAYDGPGAGPPTLIAKVPAADETSRAAAQMTRTYEIEANFYRHLAAELPVRAPVCHFASHDPATDAYVVLLEDVAPAAQGDQLAGCGLAECEAAIDELALLHGPRWGDASLLELAWLYRSQPEHLERMVTLISACVPVFLARYGERLRADTVALVERFAPRLGAYLSERRGPLTIVHGDFRCDNLLFGGERVVVVDWQTVGVGVATNDLAYFLGTSLPTQLRRRHERELVGRYAERLRAQGVDVAEDELWTRYRQGAFSGLIMAIVASALVRQTDRGDEMFLTMAERPAEQVRDLDAEALVPA